MAQQVNVAQALAAMGNAITGLTQAINQIIAGPPQQHNVSVLLQLFMLRDCRPDVRSCGMACAALRVATRLLRAWRDSYG
jgi:hypothetical protein